MSLATRRKRASIKPPKGYETCLSRREAAAALGLPSEYKIRELERQGRLRAVRGTMGMAFYPRADVIALTAEFALQGAATRPRRHWSDGDLIALLRAPTDAGASRTAVDLVLEAGISIARAERVFEFLRKAGGKVPTPTSAVPAAAAGAALAPGPARQGPVSPPERRDPARTARAALIEQLRDPDPGVREAAFARLRELPR